MKEITSIASNTDFICNTIKKVIDKTIPETKSFTIENTMFEINKQTFDEDFKSGRERRRERRLKERKNK